MRVQSPRQARGLRTVADWLDFVRAAEVAPSGWGEVYAMAFTATIDSIIEQTVAGADASRENPGSLRHSTYHRLGRVVGIGQETLRRTYHGARWVTLPEIDAALADEGLCPVMTRFLTLFAGYHSGVIEHAQNFVPGHVTAVDEVHIDHQHSSTRWSEAVMPQTVEVLKDRVRADVIALEQMSRMPNAQHNPALAGTDWGQIRVLLGVPRYPLIGGYRHGIAVRLRAEGIRNLTDVIREVLSVGRPMRSYRIKGDVHRLATEHNHARGLPAPALTSNQVDAALRKMLHRGEVVRLERGLYEATPALRAPGKE
ncbi:hypothetical protein [Kocuria sp.]|uniref:hypothetical protein n=1 Tax=Kocuria sp. TaxID=1871328 RepID=UPI0026DEE5C5|nr:hypothetical protein [Kocuria sp.]MDO5619750.1 hypothetical protein [Kocuria sp.]